MKVSCQVIEDLLPLYVDEVCQVESRVLVEEHVKTCLSCLDKLSLMKQADFKENHLTGMEATQVEALADFKKQLRKNKLRVSFISVISAVAIVVIGGFSIFMLQIPIRYEADLIGVQPLDNQKVELTFLEDDFYRCHHFQTTVRIDGEMKNILLIYYTDTLWTKLSLKQNFISGSQTEFQGKNDYTEKGWTEANWEKIRIGEGVDAVYYAVANYDYLLDHSLDSVLEKSTLLWERK